MSQPYILAPVVGSENADERVRIGIDAHATGNLAGAQYHYLHALRLDPQHAAATQNLAIVYAQSSGLINEALLTIERAEMLDPSLAIIRMNRALMALAADRIDESLASARRAVELAPTEVAPKVVLAMVLATAGHAAEAVPLYNRVLDVEPTHPLAGPNACFVQNLTHTTPAELLYQRRRWYDANGFKGPKQRHTNDRSPDRSLRVGYVGGDFKTHSASLIFARVLLHHSPAVEPYLYSSLPVDPATDGMSKKYKDMAGDRWRDIHGKSDEEVAELIRRDKIDILVDLAGHTGGGQLKVFTRKPAPIQVTAWGHAHGTGLPEMDYFFADPVTVPEAERKHYAEKIWDLPCIITLEPPDEYKLNGTSSPPIKRNGYFTFGSYSRYEKLSDDFLAAVGEILRRVPDSRMVFKDGGFRRPYSMRRVRDAMPDIDPKRLLFSINTSHGDHLLAFQQADLFLDPFPHSGGTVSVEVLYMGVPAITLYGTQPAGRSMSSILTAMGRTDWITRTPAEYIDRAVEWSDRTKELTAARQTLRQELLDSPVVKGYSEAVEAAYRQMWRTYCDG